MVGQTVSHYRITATLGRGGMGVVYRATDLRLERDVALKFLPQELAGDAEALARFRREARAASSLNHPHICTIHDIDEHDGQPFIVMELLEGGPLRNLIGRTGVNADTVLGTALQISDGLEAAHARGIIHRDITPANVFVGKNGQVKILDFGLAKFVGDRHVHRGADASQAPTMLSGTVTGSRSGATMGTVAYMSPEQVRGQPLDPRTDIFSCGVVMYELATGRRPFEGTTPGVVFDRILNEAPPPPSEINPAIPPDLGRIVDRALEKDRELRYQSARDLHADLARLHRDRTSSRPMSTVRTARVGKPSVQPRRRWFAAAAGLALVGAVLTGVFLWRGGPAAPGPPPALTRVTFEDGMQAQPSWSPDGQFIAYASNQSGNFDIWVQPLAGGRPVQITNDPASDWQPSWSSSGDVLAFRSERDGGGIYVVPAFGGLERRISTFGNDPEWAPDGSRLLFLVSPPIAGASLVRPQVYVATSDGAPPVRVLADEFSTFENVSTVTWHADSRRVFFIGDRDDERHFWTVPIDGGAAVEMRMVPSVLDNIRAAALSISGVTWSPSGDAVYFEGVTNNVSNLWRLGIDPSRDEVVSGPHRLTTGQGNDAQVAVSRDGRRLAFVTTTEQSRLWSVPFDWHARTVRSDDAQPLTSAAAEIRGFDLSADGRRLAVVSQQSGTTVVSLRIRSLDDDNEGAVGEAWTYFAPRLSRDGALVAYRVVHERRGERRLAWMNARGGEEHLLPVGFTNPWDWSPDGQRLLLSCPPPAPLPTLCWSARDATTTDAAEMVLVDPDYSLWQGRVSPDGRWVVFAAQSPTEPGVSLIGVVAAEGGEWTALSDPATWADKPRWAPDGRSIYYISSRGSPFFNVWGRAFDPTRGRAEGPELRLTSYSDPSRMLVGAGSSELGVSSTRLVVPMLEASGSVWTLDNIDSGP